MDYEVEDSSIVKPKHDAEKCGECIFVANKESIYVSPTDKKGATYKPRFLGKFTMPGWVGHLGFYIFRCKNCENVSVDYTHNGGYKDFDLICFRCDVCREKLPLELPEERGIYEREGAYIPPATKKERKQKFMKMIEIFEKKTGKKVIVIEEKNGWREFFSRLFN